MTTITATDPRTGLPSGAAIPTTDVASVSEIVRAAASASRILSGRSRHWRAGLLDAIATGLETRRTDIVVIASAETGFADAKLDGELTRTVFQLRFFGDVVREGSYLEATLDSAGDTAMGPRPDLRRMLVPIGPVAVFGASNFPLAFSVPGGDTASALAAGCAVVVKAHSSHPGTSALCHELMHTAATAYGAPEGTIGIVFGTQAGAHLVAEPAIKAVGFTGSQSGGQALLDIISERDEPIPFYGELSSINPVLVTADAASERGADIGAGLVSSFTMGAGQLCTKPGIVLVPSDPGGDALVESARKAVAATQSMVLLNSRIHSSYDENTASLASATGVRVEKSNAAIDDAGFHAAPTLFETDLAGFSSELAEETFGPMSVVVRYDPADTLGALTTLLAQLPSSLTATLHTGDSEDTSALVGPLVESAGRIVYNGFPTGVAVSWAQTHGGPWPSTNTLHTSVGATAIRRFGRPVTFQNAPQASLPEELRDAYAEIPRRVDGTLVVSENV
ncbi:aldehyde dehydrogenase (NADP(+)) [Rhodococcoides kyotonense]|uniref:NADP-dependent aldehyde dehydrogenase n=1 Tax=Rhodococcoides kyotonense TaxID=398843 RepID=A0A239N934_9NOCA|nr:aldehyde dehydrogenase (NADP(+)) [Rhodococcus kyotonensis]SNT50689.1 NADP-dependent aldehyde dehydrogenase [Rhodococcus kyotonensis]